MRPATQDEKRTVLAKLIVDLERLGADAASVDCEFLAFLLAQAQDEAQGQLEHLESGIWQERG